MKKTILSLILSVIGLYTFAQGTIQLTVKWNASASRYEVYAKPNFTQNNFNWGPSQISVVLPNSAPDASLTITSIAAGAWSDNSKVFAPSALSTSDFHGIESNGSAINLTVNTESLIFAFTFPDGLCRDGIRLFVNGTDPGSSAGGMNGGDFRNSISNAVLEDIYISNYNNNGTLCNPIADPDVANATIGSTITIPVLNNDKNLDNTPITDLTKITLPVVSTPPTKGTVSVNPDGTINYTPNGGSSGTDTFIYIICDKIYTAVTVCDTAKVTVNISCPVLTAPTGASASPSSICSGASSTLSATCATGTLTWYTDAGLTGTPLSSSTVSPTTTTTYFGACIIGICKSPASPVTVTVTTTPLAPTGAAASPSSICSGASSTLSATCATGTLTWYTDSGLTGVGFTTNSVSPTTTTTYYGACVLNTCKSPASPVTVTVTTIPLAPTGAAASPSSICSGASSTLSATCATGTLTWYTDSGLTGVGFTTNSVSPTTTTTYYGSCVLNTCKSPASPVTVTVTTTPLAPTGAAASPSSICSGASSTLSATCATGTLTWYTDSGLTGVGFTTNSVSPTTTTTYYGACVLNTCKSPASPVTVTVTTIPLAPTGAAASPSSICSGASSTLSATCATGTLTWYTDSGLTGVGFTTNSVSPTTTTTYYGACVLNTCKSPASPVTVTVTTIPLAPTGAAASPSSICSGASSTLSATCATGTLTWYTDAGLTGTPLSSSTVSPMTTTTYYGACVLNTCKSPASPVTVTVTTTPLAPTGAAASPSSICSGASSTLSATCATGTLTWYTDSGLTGVGFTTNSVSPTTTTTYYGACVLNTCKSPASLVTVTVTTIPLAPTGAAASPSSICSGASSTLSATCATGTLTWYTDSGLTGVGFTTNSVSPTTTTTYYGACVLNTCKSPASPVTVTVTTIPLAPTGAAASPSSICSGASSTLSATCTTGTLTWYTDSGLTGVGFTTNSVSPTTTTTYYGACVLNTCKSPASPVTVTVTTIPLAPTGAAASPSSICSGASSTLSATCATGTLTWYTDSGLTGVGFTTNSVGPTTTTTYYGACVLNTCKSPASPVTVTVTTIPLAPTGAAASPSSICSGASSTLSATCATGTLTWYTDSGLTGVGFTTNSVSPTTTTTYYGSCVLNTCKSPASPVTVTVTTTPLAPTGAAASPSSICSGASSTLSATCATGTLTWYTDSGLTGVGFTTNSVSPTTTTTYYGACVLNTCKSPASPVTVTVTTIPLAPTGAAASPSSICSGASSTLSATCATGTLTWYTDSGLTGVGFTTNSVSPTTTTTYYGACVLNTCKSPASPVTVTVTTIPLAPTGAAASPSSICSGASSTLSATCATGTLTWYTDAGLTGTPLSSSTVSPMTTTTYYGACVLNTCKSPASPVTVTVTTTPLAPTGAAASPSSICSGASSTLSATCATGTLTWYTDSGLTGVGFTTNSVSPTTTTTYYGACVLNTCKSPASPVTVTVTTIPLAPTGAAASPSSICSGASSTLSATCATGTLTWYTDAGLTGTPLSSSTVSPMTTTTYYGACVLNTCKSPASPVTVTVTTTPLAPTGAAASPSSICSGASSTLSATCATGTLTWYTDSGLTGVGFTTNSVSPTTTTTYYGACVLNTCKSPASLVTVTVTTIPLAPTGAAASPSSICSGASSTLSATCATGTLTWYTDSGLTGVGFTTNSVSPTTTTTYYGACVLNTCKSPASPVTVTVTTIPLAPTGAAASPSSICSGASSTLSATCATGTLTWYTDSGLTGVGFTTNSVSPTTTTTYYGSCVLNTCKSPASPVTVTVTTTPLAPTGAAASPSSICSGASSTLSATCATGTLTWYTDSGLTGVGFTTNSVSPTTTTTYYGACVLNTCKSPASPVTVTVTTIPLAPTGAAASPSSICSGASSTLSATCATGTLTWYTDSGLTGVGFTTNSVSPTTTTTYYGACVLNTCKSPASPVTVTVTTIPLAPTGAAASPSSICSGASSTLSATCATGTLTWYTDAGLTGTPLSSSTVSPMTTTTYYGACVLNTCKSPASPVTVTVTTTPLAPTGAAASPSSICSGASSTLSATCATGTLTWYTDSGLTGVGFTTNSVSPTTTTTYYGACVLNTCKSPASPVTVTVTTIPLAPTGAAASPSSICSGASSTLSATCTTGTLTWYTDSGLTGVGFTTNSVSPTTTTTYYGACVLNTCKSPASPVTVTVTTIPLAPTGAAASPSSICSGASSTLSATCATGTLTWYTDSGLTGVGFTTNSVGPTTTTTYYGACVLNTCKSPASPVTVTVTTIPLAPTGAAASPSSICSGASSTLSATCATGTLTWYTDSGLTGVGFTTNSVSPTTTTTYYGACVLNTCKSPASPVTVTVTTIPLAPTGAAASPSSICSGASSTLSATCATGTLTWYTDAGLTGTPLSSSTVSPMTTTTYYGACVLNTCKSPASPVTVTVTTTPLPPTGAAASPSSICSGASSTLSATCATGTLTWYTDAGLTGTPLSSSTVSPTTTTTYYGVCVLNTCKSPASPVTVTVSLCVITNPDINVTQVNVPVPGNVNTNDKNLPVGTTYGTPIPSPSNPSSCSPVMASSGSYIFVCSTPGVYNFNVPVCPPGVTVNCPLVPLVITVTDATIPSNNGPIANTDIASTPINVPVTLKTLANDMSGNAIVTLNPSSVSVITAPKNGITSVNTTTGDITYTPNTGFVGNDTLTYKVCDNASPAKCATALQIVTILPASTPNTTVAADDYVATPVNMPVAGNVKTNDSDPEGQPQTVTAQTTTIAGKGTLVLSTTGTYTFTPASGYVGPVEFIYTTCDNGSPQACANATLHILVNPVLIAKLNLKVLLQGALLPSSSNSGIITSGIMRDDLRTAGVIPRTEPYTALGTANSRFTHVGGGGGEVISLGVLNTTGNDAIVDWVFVELRDANNPSIVLKTKSALVQRDGDVVEASDGISSVTFTGAVGQSYYVSVKHRNHLGAMTATAIPMTVVGTTVDFTSMTAAQMYNNGAQYDGFEQVDVNGKMALWAGNTDADNKVKYVGVSNDQIPVFFQVLGFVGNTAQQYNYDFVSPVYLSGDINMDAKVKYRGPNNDPTFIFFNVITKYAPLNSASLYNYDLFLEQLP